jgi:hypothetical protein
MKLLTGPALPEGRVRHGLWLALALVAALVLLWRPDPVEPVSAVEAAATLRRDVPQGLPVATGLTGDLPERSPAVDEAPNAFASHSWYVPPPPRPAEPPPKAIAPTAPPLPFSFLGSYSESGGARVYYLVKGDRVYDVRSGDTIDHIYQVGREEGGSLVLTYLPLNQRQLLAIGG